MKVYFIDTVATYDDTVFAFIYPKNKDLKIFSTFDKALQFFKNDRCPVLGIDPKYIYTVADEENPAIHYIFEKENEKILDDHPDLWAVIIEADLE